MKRYHRHKKGVRQETGPDSPGNHRRHGHDRQYLVKEFVARGARLKPFVKKRSKTDATFKGLAVEYAEARERTLSPRLSCIFASVGLEPATIFYHQAKANEAIVSATAGKAAVTVLRPYDFLENIFTRVGIIKLGAVYGNQDSAALSTTALNDCNSQQIRNMVHEQKQVGYFDIIKREAIY
ncbi:hypothetical protein HDU96_006289 [Phlyctochytrium bullatum]|nr:hypothetical protein HDU96_006289 [Phlyctochytrium bullatum]